MKRNGGSDSAFFFGVVDGRGARREELLATD